MSKRMIGVVVAILLVASFCYAQVPRSPQHNYDGKSNVAALGITGQDVSYNPAYIELQAPDLNGAVFSYYLWVDVIGNLRIASYPTMSAFSSFPTGNWLSTAYGGGATASGVIVGLQNGQPI